MSTLPNNAAAKPIFLVSFREVADVLFLVEHLPIKKFFKGPKKSFSVCVSTLRAARQIQILWSEVINEEVFIDKGRVSFFHSSLLATPTPSMVTARTGLNYRGANKEGGFSCTIISWLGQSVHPWNAESRKERWHRHRFWELSSSYCYLLNAAMVSCFCSM